MGTRVLARMRRLLPLLWLAALPAAADTITTLPKMEVHDSLVAPEREAWRYAETPNFLVLSQAPDSASQNVVAQLERFESLLDVAFPTFLAGSPQPRLTLILCTSDSRFKPFENDPLESIILVEDHHRLRSIVVDMKLGGLSAGEYAHLERAIVLGRMANLHPRYPVWFEEGMAQIASHMRADAKQIVFNQQRDTVSTRGLEEAGAAGALSDPDTALTELTTTQAVNAVGLQVQASSGAKQPTRSFDAAQADTLDQDFFTYFNGAPLLPLATLFSTARGAPDTLDPSGEWAKECWAFTDYCLYSAKQKRRLMLTQFMRSIDQNPGEDLEAAFRASFGQSYSDAGASLRGYLGGREIEHVPLAHPPAEPEPATFAEATDGQIARLKGDTLAGREKWDEARREYLGAYQRGERDPAFLGGFGAIEAEGPLDGTGRAETFLRAALAAHPTDEVRVALARLRLKAALAVPAAGDRLSKDQTKLAFEPLLEATPAAAADPRYFDVIASIWAHSSVSADRGQLALLVRGCRLFPDDTDLILDTSAVVRKAGFPDIASGVVKLGVLGAVDDSSRTRLSAAPAHS